MVKRPPTDEALLEFVLTPARPRRLVIVNEKLAASIRRLGASSANLSEVVKRYARANDRLARKQVK